MNFKTTIVLLVLLAAAAAFLAVQRFAGRNKPEETTPANPNQLVTATTDQITKVSITQPDGTHIVLVKKGKDWNLTEPIQAKADTFAVDELLRQITGLQTRGQLKADQKASVGLDKPQLAVEITAESKTTKLEVGEENKIGDSLYILVDDKPEPQIVATSIYDQLNKPASEYRSKKLTDLAFENEGDIKQLTITQSGKALRLEKHGSDWEIVEPKKMPADSSAVSSLLTSLTDLNATDYVNSPSVPAVYGLTDPALTISYSTAAPATAPSTKPASHEIAFGRFASVEHNQVYASADGGPIATVGTTTEDSFKKTALDLRDKKVVDIDPAHVTGFTLAIDRAATTQPTTKPSEQVEYTINRRKENHTLGPALPTTQPATTNPSSKPAVASTQPESKWVIESGGSGAANDADVDALLSALHPLNATKFVESAPTTRPAASYTLTVHVGPANGHGPEDQTLKLNSLGSTGDVTGTYEDLTFETDRTVLDKLDANFKAAK